jgi:hypothetical protein
MPKRRLSYNERRLQRRRRNREHAEQQGQQQHEERPDVVDDDGALQQQEDIHDIAVEEDDDALLPLDVLPHVLHTDGATAHPIPPVNPALPEIDDDDGAMGLEPPQPIALNDHVYAGHHDDAAMTA